jgi:hypothetical protein
MYRNFLTLLSVFILVIFVSTVSCKHEIIDGGSVTPTDTSSNNNNNNNNNGSSGVDNIGWKCSTDTAYFVNDVLPLVVSSCAVKGCHDAATREDGYQLTDYANIIKKGISAGKANSSKFYTEISSGSMPPRNSGITMTTTQKNLIAKWINQGAKNTSCNANFGQCDTTTVKFSTYIAPLVQKQCQGCHTSTAPKLTNYTEIKASIQTGKFWGSINHNSGFSAMPQGTNKLSTCDLNKINAWIKRGALNN